MYLSELKLWNFRKFGTSGSDRKAPGMQVKFNSKINLLVGENDSGKSAIIDAIKHVFGTNSNDYIRISVSDFHKKNGKERTDWLRIECTIRGFSVPEAAQFLDWISIEKDEKGVDQYFLVVRLEANTKGLKVLYDVTAGNSKEGNPMLSSYAREALRVTFLKALRDANSELTPGRRSRVAQILKNMKSFAEQKDSDGIHPLVSIAKSANIGFSNYFESEPDTIGEGATLTKQGGGFVLQRLNKLMSSFLPSGDDRKVAISAIGGDDLTDVLNRLSVGLDNSEIAGLGTQNLLFIATELLLLEQEETGNLRLALIEELESHLHPQAQLQMVDYLQNHSEDFNVQMILTSHSISLASKVKLENLIICRGDDGVFPMAPESTKLSLGDHSFLEAFLDATKANLFFARGVIFVEGISENIIIPKLAELIGLPLEKYGVSIVNTGGNQVFSKYCKIFFRKDGESMGTRLSIVTDMDVPTVPYLRKKEENKKLIYTIKESDLEGVLNKYSIVLDVKNIGDFSMNDSFEDLQSIVKIAVRQKLGKKNAPQGFSDDLVKIIAKKEIDSENISEFRTWKKKKFRKLFEKSIAVCVSEEWTLEHDIAGGEFQEEMMMAVLLADQISEFDLENRLDELRNTSRDRITQLINVEELEVAYGIYELIATKKLSKVVVAQNFVRVLSVLGKNDRALLKSRLDADQLHIGYLIDAIKHATGN
jgi:putative ATP-dependent endonuclease of the OLD family